MVISTVINLFHSMFQIFYIVPVIQEMYCLMFNTVESRNRTFDSIDLNFMKKTKFREQVLNRKFLRVATYLTFCISMHFWRTIE